MVDFTEILNLRGNNEIMVLDVRNEFENSAGGVEGAHHIPHTRIHERVSELPHDKRIYVHCQAGNRSAVAVAYLKKHGYDVVQVEDNFNRYIYLIGEEAKESDTNSITDGAVL